MILNKKYVKYIKIFFYFIISNISHKNLRFKMANKKETLFN